LAYLSFLALTSERVATGYHVPGLVERSHRLRSDLGQATDRWRKAEEARKAVAKAANKVLRVVASRDAIGWGLDK
jgi:hypothetical protein